MSSTYEYVTTPDRLQELVPILAACHVLGFDVETAASAEAIANDIITGLDPHQGRLRLIQLATPEKTYIFDCFRVNPAPLAPIFDGLDGPQLWGQNLKFEMKWLMAAGLPLPHGLRIFDTMIGQQILFLGSMEAFLNRCSLESLALTYLNRAIDKTEQVSNWSLNELSTEQLNYAALDAEIMFQLQPKMLQALKSYNLERTIKLEMRALPGIAAIEYNGIGFDADYWYQLADKYANLTYNTAQQLGQTVTNPDMPVIRGYSTGLDLFGESWINWSSWKQVQKIMAARGFELDSTDEEALYALRYQDPVAALMLEYREYNKKATTYGHKWLGSNLHPKTGRVHASLHQCGTKTGRMSSSKPNIQQIPRTAEYRRAFQAAPGNVLVKCDFSSIEARLAAYIAPDRTLASYFQRQQDPYIMTAAVLLGVAPKDVTKSQRQVGKVCVLALLYGMGANKLRRYASMNFNMDVSDQQAYSWRAKFFQLYTGLQRWHNSVEDGVVDVRTLSNRQIRNVERFTEKLNFKVQGSAADGMKAALALLMENKHLYPGAKPVLCVHDELVVECPATIAEEVKPWLEGCMITGMSNFMFDVPTAVESTIAKRWSGDND
jgi:DNA polymerase-1